MLKILLVELLAQTTKIQEKTANLRFTNENYAPINFLPVKILAAKFLLVMEIMMKHCRGQFIFFQGHTVVPLTVN